VSQVGTTVEPGWRPDPSGRFDWRYWDGGWTNRVANSAPAAPAAPPAAPSAVPEAVAQSPEAVETEPGPVEMAVAPRVEPFGPEVPSTPLPPPPPPTPTKRRRTPWAWLVAFFRSFADQPESYHSPDAAPELPPVPRGEYIVAPPGNYGLAGIVALAACGIAGGAYLPWLSGTIDGIPFHRSGFDLGHGWGYSLGAMALALSALLAVRMRMLRWVTMILSLVLAGFVVRDLMSTYDSMQSMNLARAVAANVGDGLLIMVVSAAIAMFAAVRLSEDEKIV
jgi:hypothetical protein